MPRSRTPRPGVAHAPAPEFWRSISDAYTTCELARRTATAYLPGTAIHDTRADHVDPNPRQGALPQVNPYGRSTPSHSRCEPHDHVTEDSIGVDDSVHHPGHLQQHE